MASFQAYRAEEKERQHEPYESAGSSTPNPSKRIMILDDSEDDEEVVLVGEARRGEDATAAWVRLELEEMERRRKLIRARMFCRSPASQLPAAAAEEEDKPVAAEEDKPAAAAEENKPAAAEEDKPAAAAEEDKPAAAEGDKPASETSSDRLTEEEGEEEDMYDPRTFRRPPTPMPAPVEKQPLRMTGDIWPYAEMTSYMPGAMAAAPEATDDYDEEPKCDKRTLQDGREDANVAWLLKYLQLPSVKLAQDRGEALPRESTDEFYAALAIGMAAIAARGWVDGRPGQSTEQQEAELRLKDALPFSHRSVELMQRLVYLTTTVAATGRKKVEEAWLELQSIAVEFNKVRAAAVALQEAGMLQGVKIPEEQPIIPHGSDAAERALTLMQGTNENPWKYNWMARWTAENRIIVETASTMSEMRATTVLKQVSGAPWFV